METYEHFILTIPNDEKKLPAFSQTYFGYRLIPDARINAVSHSGEVLE